jgi:TPR repeat protein
MCEVTQPADGAANVEPGDDGERWTVSDTPLQAAMDARAQFDMAEALHYGHGVPEDHPAAAEWYRRAAEQGMPQAQGMLGLLYLEGDGVPQDDSQAAAWVRKAAEEGDRDGQIGLASLYEVGRGVPQDDAQAASWYRKAAEAGEPVAQHKIGILCFFGRGVRQSYVEAFFWFDLASLWRFDDEMLQIVTRDLTLAQSHLPPSIQQWLNALHKSRLGDGFGI